MTNSATSATGSATAQGVVAQTTVNTQQTAQVQQGQGSSGNSVNLTVGVNANNQGDATAGSGDATATGMAGSTSFSATVATSASAGQPASSQPGTATTSSTTTQTGGTPTSAVAATVSVAATTSAAATSGNAAAVGVNAQTTITGDQAVVVHIPANTSGQTVHVTLDATVQNTGTATSQSGNVQAAALMNGAPGSSTPPSSTSNSATPPNSAGGAAPTSNTVDVRDVNYALAQSGDAMAIGVKANTVIDGVQQILVIIDDNSSGNRIIITFDVNVQNTGSATATTGSTSALGRNGALQTPGGATSGSLAVQNDATALTGSATAIGVEANTQIGVNQYVLLQAGQNSNDNEVDVDFEAAVSNSGTATAQSGDAQAMAQSGDVGPRAGTSSNTTNTLATSAVAIGSSGATDATGVMAGTTLSERQPVQVTVDNNNPLPISITQSDRVINLGFANSRSGAAAVIAQVDPPPAPPSDGTSASPTPSASPIPAASSQPSGSGSSPTILRVADPANFTVSVAPMAPAANTTAPASSQVAGAVTVPAAPAAPGTVTLPAAIPSAPAGLPGSGSRVGSGEQAATTPDATLGADPADEYAMVLVSWGDLSSGGSDIPTHPATTPPASAPRPALPAFPMWSIAAAIPGLLALVRGRWSLLP